MNDDEFRALAAQLREAQKAYFLRRSPERLQAAKKLERLIDAELKKPAETTPSLFDRPQA